MRLGLLTASWQAGDIAEVEQVGERWVLRMGRVSVTYDTLGALERALDQASHDVAQHKAQQAHEAVQT